MEQHSLYINASDDEADDNADQVQQTSAESERSMAELAEKQARIDELEAALDANRTLLSDQNRAQSILVNHPEAILG